MQLHMQLALHLFMYMQLTLHLLHTHVTRITCNYTSSCNTSFSITNMKGEEEERRKRIETILGIVLKGLVLDDAISDNHRIGSLGILCHFIHLDNHSFASFDIL